MKQRITVLGSTGSIGTSTLDVVARHPDRFEVFALSAATQVELMLQQCARFKPRFAVMASLPHGRELAQKIKANGLAVEVLSGLDAIELVACHELTDTVMAAIVGAAGLAACLAAARAGMDPMMARMIGVFGDQIVTNAPPDEDMDMPAPARCRLLRHP